MNKKSDNDKDRTAMKAVDFILSEGIRRNSKIIIFAPERTDGRLFYDDEEFDKRPPREIYDLMCGRIRLIADMEPWSHIGYFGIHTPYCAYWVEVNSIQTNVGERLELKLEPFNHPLFSHPLANMN